MRSPMPPAQSSELARSAPSCSRSAPPAPRRAGRSSSRIRERSCFCCCWPSRSPPTCSACSSCRCSADGAQPAGSFGTGALAAFVATPCAGPFLGAALGTALLLPPAGSVLVFAALGFGLALPFVAVAFVPALRTQASETRPVDAPPAALPRDPDGRDRNRRALAALSARRAARRSRLGTRGWRCSGMLFCLSASGNARRDAIGSAILRAGCDARHGLAIVAVRGPLADARARRRRRTVERSARRELRRSRASRSSSISPPTGASAARSTRRPRSTATKCAMHSGGRGEGRRRRLDQRRPCDHPLPRKPGPRRRATLSLVRARASRRSSCRRS